MSQKNNMHVTARRSHPLVWGVVALVVIIALWTTGVAVVRRREEPASLVSSLGTGITVEKVEDLPDRLGQLGAFPRWKVTRDGSFAGYIYTFPLGSSSPSLLNRLLLAPRAMEFAVYIDNLYAVQSMRQVYPRWPASSTAFTAQYVGSNLYQLIGTDDGDTFAAGGDLAGPGRQIMRTLAGSIYVADVGEDAFNRLVAESNTPGLRLQKPFPAFRATSAAGQQLDTASLKGKYTAIVFSEPTCGSCYQAAMELLTTLKLRTSGWNVIAVAFGEAEIDPVKRFVKEAGEQGAQVIVDPERAIGKQMRQTEAPYAVLLDKDTNVLFSGGALEQNGVYTVLEGILKGAK
ncbi:MAG: TlpA disulfide reductase family protein [Candidatus Cryosericum sp.]|nr:TlpA family protein disulfide reductase [bacterium]